MEYLFFRICENIQKNIQNLSNLQQKDSQDTRAIALCEDNIRVMIAIIDKALGQITSNNRFRFLYFDDILDLTPSIDTLQILTMLAFKIMQVYRLQRDPTTSMLGLYAFMTPFSNLMSHFDQDLQVLIESVTKISNERRNTNEIPEALEKLLLVVLQDNQSSLDELKTYYLQKGLENRQLFITELTRIICEKNNFTRQNNRESYFQTLGWTTLISFLLESQLDEQFCFARTTSAGPYTYISFFVFFLIDL